MPSGCPEGEGGRPWTAREAEALRVCWGKVPIAVIAAKLHRTEAAVRTRASVMGLGGRHVTFTPEVRARMREMAEAGATVPEIARAVGVTARSARNRLARDGVRASRLDGARLWTPAEVEQLKAYMRDGVDSATVARRMGRTKGAVNTKRSWINKRGGCWE